MNDNLNPTDKTNNNNNDDDDHVLIKKADEEAAEERLLVAARLLKKVRDQSLLEPKHHTILRVAADMEIGMKDLLSSPDDQGWKRQSETHGHYNFMVYYRVDPQTSQLTCRIDSVIESSLLIPILSVFNESSLFKTWMPSYTKPIKLGIQETNTLQEAGRGNQIIQIVVKMAWPLATREVVMHVRAVDAIDEKGIIAIRAESETTEDNPIIPQPKRSVVRIYIETDGLFQQCPTDHPCLVASKQKEEHPSEEEPMILFSIKTTVDAHVKYVPLSLINFITRTFIGRLWASNLKVAEDIRDGNRPLHQEAIDSKRELYDWIEKRVAVMMDKKKAKE